MKALFAVGCSMALALAPAWVSAQELQWRPAGSKAAAPQLSDVIPVGLSRPVPLDDPTVGGARPVVRAQNPEDSRPLPPGPPTGSGPAVPPATLGFAPFTISQAPTQPVMPKAGEFVAPQPQPAPPSANVWGPPVGSDQFLGITGQCGDPGCSPGANSCCASGWLGNLLSWFHCKPDACCAPCPPCPDLCCNPCNPCCAGNRPRYWVFADYLYWVPQNQSYPPLVTASLTGGTGVLGAPGTIVLFNRFNDPGLSGMRIGGGGWFQKDGCWGADASYWFLSSSGRTAGFGNQ